jgi:hypothetical protein
MCALDAYEHATTCFTCLNAFQVSGLHPLSLDVVPKPPDVRRSDDDPERGIEVKNPGRAFTGSQELTSDAWAARVQECGGMAWRGLWRVMPKPALFRPLTWSSVGTNSFVRRRSEASMPMRATSSREGRRAEAEAGSEGLAAPRWLVGWLVGEEQAAADLLHRGPRGSLPLPPFGAPAPAVRPQALMSRIS